MFFIDYIIVGFDEWGVWLGWIFLWILSFRGVF